METTISSSLNCFLQDISVPCLVQWRPNSAWRFLTRNNSQDSASLKMPGLFLIQLLLLVKLSFTFVKSRNFFNLKVFTTYFSLEKEMIPFKRNLTDFLCMILSCVCFFVARKYRWRFLRGCWTGRAKCNFYLLGLIWPYFGFVYSGNFSEQLQKYLVVI